MPLIVPCAIALVGAAWMLLASNHYEDTTGRRFYGLAGYHYSMPEWGFEYYPGGEVIAARTVVYPPNVTFIALVCSAIAFIIRRWGSAWQVVGVLLTHGVVAIGFALVAAWFWMNVMGVFI